MTCRCCSSYARLFGTNAEKTPNSMQEVWQSNLNRKETQEKKKKRKENETYHFKNMPYKLSMSNHNSNNKKYKNIVTTRSSWSPPHHFRRCVNNTDGGNMYTQQYEHERRTQRWHFRSPDHLDFYFVLSWYFRPERWWETVSGFLLRSEQQSAFLFFSSLISFRFVRLYVLLSPSDCHDDHQAGNRLSGIRGRDIKKEPGNPGRMGTLIPCLCHRSQNVFSASKTLRHSTRQRASSIHIQGENIHSPPRSITECCGV